MGSVCSNDVDSVHRRTSATPPTNRQWIQQTEQFQKEVLQKKKKKQTSPEEEREKSHRTAVALQTAIAQKTNTASLSPPRPAVSSHTLRPATAATPNRTPNPKVPPPSTPRQRPTPIFTTATAAVVSPPLPTHRRGGCPDNRFQNYFGSTVEYGI